MIDDPCHHQETYCTSDLFTPLIFLLLAHNIKPFSDRFSHESLNFQEDLDSFLDSYHELNKDDIGLNVEKFFKLTLCHLNSQVDYYKYRYIKKGIIFLVPGLDTEGSTVHRFGMK